MGTKLAGSDVKEPDDLDVRPDDENEVPLYTLKFLIVDSNDSQLV